MIMEPLMGTAAEATDVLRVGRSAVYRLIWQLLGRAMPDCHDRKHELAQRGAGLWFGETE
jgi:hypothetical protein